MRRCPITVLVDSVVDYFRKRKVRRWMALWNDGRTLDGHNGLGIWWSDLKDSTHLEPWKDVNRDLKKGGRYQVEVHR